MGRREQSAAETKRAIIRAAREVFAKKGYAKARAEDIAQAAGVATITVYSVVGGKTGLVKILFEVWMDSPIRTVAIEKIGSSKDPVEIFNIAAHAAREQREEYADIIYAMHDAAPFDEIVAENFRSATERYRASCLMVAERLREMGGLRDDISVSDAAEILWFYFGYWSWYALHEENAWTYDRAEAWLHEAAAHAILKPAIVSAAFVRRWNP